MIISEKHSTSNHVVISVSNLDWEQSPLVAISDIKTGFQHVSRMNQKKCKQKQIFSEQLDTYEITKPIYLFRAASAQCAMFLTQY